MRRDAHLVRWIGPLGLLLALSLASSVRAASEDTPDSTSGLTGDWGGLRTRLADEGWTFDIRQKVEGGYNASGGSRRSVDGAGETRIGVIADLGKIAGVSGGTVHLMLTQRYGAGLGGPSGLDPLMSIIEVHGRGDIARLTQLWYEQKLAHGAVDLKLGRMNPGSDFDAFGCDFENLTFCGSPPGNIVGDYWYNWPVSQWGARVKLTHGNVYFQAGAYQVNPVNLKRGFTFNVSGGKGVLAPAEVGWTPKLGAAKLPGTYLVGGWYSDTEGPDLLLDAQGGLQPITGRPSLKHRGRYGAYLSATQQVTGKANGPGLTLFANVTLADHRTERIDRQVAIGAEYKGLLASRPKDTLALAVGETHVNDRLERAEELIDATDPSAPPPQDAEWAGELDYRIHAGPGVTLTPNLQYLVDSHGVSGRDGLVLGFKAVLKL